MIGQRGRYEGLLYRALNPVYAQDPLSGEGASKYGGRFNAKGTPALYVTTRIQTAILEINQVGTLQPTVLVAYEADLIDVFDATHDAALTPYQMSADLLAAPTWRDEMRRGGTSKTQRFSQALIADGFSAMKVRSFARGAGPRDINLVLWVWNDGANQLKVIDDDERL